MNAHELIRIIERIAPLEGQARWDKSGVQVAGPDADVSRLAVTLDPTPASIKKALSLGADFILSHHPLAIDPKLPNRNDNYHAALRLLFRADCWLYSAHTSLDSRPDGPPRWLARELDLRGLSHLEPMGRDSAGVDIGIGFVGELPEPATPPELLLRLQDLLDGRFVSLAGPEPREVRRVACCPGSGASLIDAAFAAGADVYVTGDLKYHQALEAPGLVADVGHFALEERMMRELAELLAAELAEHGVETLFVPGEEPLRLLARVSTLNEDDGVR